jgi:NADH-quinone oxidoreductase subunit J
MDLTALIPPALGLLALIFSIMVIAARNLVYSAAYLSILGLSVAGLIAILGYPIVAVLHIIIYIGAGILFIVMSVSMIREVVERRASKALSLVVAVVASLPLFYLAIMADNPGSLPQELSDYSLLSRYISQSYWLPALLVFLSLSIALIAAIEITRARVGRR